MSMSPRAAPIPKTQVRLPLGRTPALRPTHGGRRRGAGRKPKHSRAMVGHIRRERIRRPMPVHLTLRMLPHVNNLRAKHRYRVVRDAIGRAAQRYVLIQQFSVQGNHIHLLVDAPSDVALTRCVQGLAKRIGPRLNAEMGTRGRVLQGRYHVHICKTPREVRAVRHYIRTNFVRHQREHAARHSLPMPKLARNFVDPCSSDAPNLPFVLPKARAWLLVTTRPRR